MGMIYYFVFIGGDVVFKLNIGQFWSCFIFCVQCVVVNCIVIKGCSILNELRFFDGWVVFFVIDSKIVYVSVFVGFVVDEFVVMDDWRRVSIVCQVILVGIIRFFNLV